MDYSTDKKKKQIGDVRGGYSKGKGTKKRKKTMVPLMKEGCQRKRRVVSKKDFGLTQGSALLVGNGARREVEGQILHTGWDVD